MRGDTLDQWEEWENNMAMPDGPQLAIYSGLHCWLQSSTPPAARAYALCRFNLAILLFTFSSQAIFISLFNRINL